MMKALLFCPVHGNEWVKQYFRNHPVYLLPFANKPAVEFALDYCFLSGIRDVRIISDEESDVLRMQFRRGEMLAMNLSYGGMPRIQSKSTLPPSSSETSPTSLKVRTGSFSCCVIPSGNRFAAFRPIPS